MLQILIQGRIQGEGTKRARVGYNPPPSPSNRNTLKMRGKDYGAKREKMKFVVGDKSEEEMITLSNRNLCIPNHPPPLPTNLTPPLPT